jgi:hypothetical protein
MAKKRHAAKTIKRMLTPAEIRQRERLFAEVKARTWKCVRPIFRDDELNGRSDLEGSCVLLKIGEQPFLLSAGHLFLDRHAHLRVLPGSGPLVPLTPIQIFNTSNPDQKNEDEFDVAVVPLCPEIAQHFTQDELLSVDDLDVHEIASEGKIYSAFGYPVAYVRKTDEGQINLNATTLRTMVKIETYKHLKLFQNTHFVVEFDRVNMARPTGDRATAPDPHGMSGGGLFRIEGNKAKLVGILIEWRNHKKVIVATHIGFCLELIRRQFPEASAALPIPRFLFFASEPDADAGGGN